MAEVTVIHSVVIRATGSTAIDILASHNGYMGVIGLCSCAIVRVGVVTSKGFEDLMLY